MFKKRITFFEQENELYELDDISLQVDGIKNTFIPTFNYDKISISNPFELLITIDNVIQSGYVYNKDYVHLNHCLDSNKGYTIDSDGNIKFSKSISINSTIMMRTVAGFPYTKYRTYPFSGLDIMMV
jgi:hypothetical protein